MTKLHQMKAKILFAAMECSPFFKTGGLGDVVGALPEALASQSACDVRVILPYFPWMNAQENLHDVTHFTVNVGWRKQYCGIKSLKRKQVTYYFVDNLYYFGRRQIYGYYDDGERFAFFQQAVIDAMQRLNFIPDILHLNDYHTAFIPFLLKEKYAYRNIKTVLTIHNLEFQGQYGADILGELFGMDWRYFDEGQVRFDGCVNFLKTGIEYTDQVTTVSPAYAQEIQTPQYGKRLAYYLKSKSGKLRGILNGIDTQVYNPQTDSHLFEKYAATAFDKKKINRQKLQEMLGLPVTKGPMIGIVSRMTVQKGFDWIVHEMGNLMQFNVQVVLLGTGDQRFEHDFRYFNEHYPDKCRAILKFDPDLAQKIYAAADILLMPSKFEPCGLAQMIAMRYGTVPVIHETGGLADTVTPYNRFTGNGNGFGFKAASSFWMMQALKKAIKLYQHRPTQFKQIAINDMHINHSWAQACKGYLKMYQDLLN